MGPAPLADPQHDQRRAGRLPPRLRSPGGHDRARSGHRPASTGRWRQDVQVPPSHRHQVLQRRRGEAGGLPPRDRAGLHHQPRRRPRDLLLLGDFRSTPVRADPPALRPRAGHRRQRPGEHRHLPPHGTGPGVPRQAHPPIRRRRPRRNARPPAQPRAAARHRPLPDAVVRAAEKLDPGPEPAVPPVVQPGTTRRLPRPDRPAVRRRARGGGQRRRAWSRRRAADSSPVKPDPPAGDPLCQPAAHRSRGGHLRAVHEHGRATVQRSCSAPRRQLRHRQEPDDRAGRRPADRTARLPDPPPDDARLSALLPVHDQPQPGRRLDGTQPRTSRATRPRLRHAWNQGDAGGRWLRRQYPGPAGRSIPRLGTPPARIPSIAESHRPGDVLPAGRRLP